MKKNAIAALAAIMALSATACSNNSGSANSASTANTSTMATNVPATSESEQSATDQNTSAPESVPTQEASAPGSDVDLQAVYDKIMAAQENPGDIIMFPESSDHIINSFYSGLTDLDIKQMVLYMPPVTGNACEILLVEASDSENADKAEAIMKARVKVGADDTTYPEVAEVWQTHAMVERSGDLLCMIALPMSCNVPDDVFAL